jgi:hypothetical protein
LSRPTYDMIARWIMNSIPVEVRLIEALHIIERLRDENETLKRRVHNQRVANRETWEIVEMRRKWLGSDTSRQMYLSLLKRYRQAIGLDQDPVVKQTTTPSQNTEIQSSKDVQHD